jgi:GNAT superfamily N-acetyltransferase
MDIRDIYPRDNPERKGVTSQAMDAAYVRLYHIYTAEEMNRFEKGEIKPSWPQGKEEHFFIAMLDYHVSGVADLTRLPDGWRLVEPMHVLPRFWGCGIGKKLWDACLRTAIREGAPGIRVWSLDKNLQANAFYRKRGCKPTDKGTLTLIAHPELGLPAHVEQVTGFECPIVPST